MATLEELREITGISSEAEEAPQEQPLAEEQAPVPQQESEQEALQQPSEEGLTIDAFADITGDASSSEQGLESQGSGLSVDAFADITDESDSSQETGTELEQASQEILGFKVPKNLLEKEEITVEDVRDLSFEQVMALADATSPLKYNAKLELSNALRQSATSGLGEIFAGNIFSRSDLETLLEGKYEDYIERNPDKSRNILQQIAGSINTGSPVNNLVAEGSQILNTPFRAAQDATAAAGLGGLGDEFFRAIGNENAARAMETSQQQLQDNEVAGDAVLANLGGALIPASALTKAYGVGSAGVGLGGNILRGAGAGATEGALFGLGESEGSIEERIPDAVTGAGLGAVLGGAGPAVAKAVTPIGRSVGGLFSSSINQNNVARRTLRRTVADINNLLRGNDTVNGDELIEGLTRGISLQRQLVDKGLSSKEAERVVEGISGGSREMLNTIERTGNELLRTRMAANSDALQEVGVKLERARRNITPEQIKSIVKETLDLDQGGLFQTEILYPALDKLIKANRNSIVMKAGYTRRNAHKAKPHIDPETGDLYVVKPDAQGNPVSPNSNGLYDPDQLYEVRPSGSFVTNLREITDAIKNPRMGAGSGVTRTQGYEDYDPIAQNLASWERRVSPESAQLADLSRRTRVEGEAMQAGAKGTQSKREFITELSRDFGEFSDLPADQRASIQKIAEEFNTLSNVGSSQGLLSKLPQGIASTISDFRIAGMFSGSVAGFGRIFILRQIANFVRTALGSDTALSRAESVLEPVVQNLMRADDAQITNMIRRAIESGAKTDQAFTNFFARSFPSLLAGNSGGEAAPQQPSAEQDLMGQLGAQ